MNHHHRPLLVRLALATSLLLILSSPLPASAQDEAAGPAGASVGEQGASRTRPRIGLALGGGRTKFE